MRAHRVATLVLLLLVAAIAAGCHDEQRLRERLEGSPTRLPVEPDQAQVLPPPALLDTIGPWRQPSGFDARATRAWQVVTLDVGERWQITYRVPPLWQIGDGDDGQARSRDGAVTARARMTQIEEQDLALASYAAQLAEGAPLWQRVTADQHVVYLTRREVLLAPTEPDAPAEVFHSSVLSIDGRIVKLDVRYDTDLDWRWDDLAAAVTGTLEVLREPEPTP